MITKFLFQYSALQVPYPKDVGNVKSALDTEQKEEVIVCGNFILLNSIVPFQMALESVQYPEYIFVLVLSRIFQTFFDEVHV